MLNDRQKIGYQPINPEIQGIMFQDPTTKTSVTIEDTHEYIAAGLNRPKVPDGEIDLKESGPAAKRQTGLCPNYRFYSLTTECPDQCSCEELGRSGNLGKGRWPQGIPSGGSERGG